MFMVEKSGVQKFVVGNSKVEILGLKKKSGSDIPALKILRLKKFLELKVSGLRCHATFLRTFLAVMVQNKKIIYIAHHNVQF